MDQRGLLRVTLSGHVQGVFFRAFVQNKAEELGLKGYVRNLPHMEAVELEAEGEREKLEKLLSCVKAGPPGARVDSVDVTWSEYTGKYRGFHIRG